MNENDDQPLWVGIVAIVLVLGMVYALKEGSCTGALLVFGAMFILTLVVEQAKKERAAKLAPGNGIVYVIKAGQHYKIGMTYDLHRRVKSLQTGNAQEIEVVHTIATADPERVEAELHDQFRDKRLKGEWFALTSRDVWNIKRKK